MSIKTNYFFFSHPLKAKRNVLYQKTTKPGVATFLSGFQNPFAFTVLMPIFIIKFPVIAFLTLPLKQIVTSQECFRCFPIPLLQISGEFVRRKIQ